MRIPNLHQIERQFRQNVANPAWRAKRQPAPPVVYSDAQKDLFDYLMRLAREGERRHLRTIQQIRRPAEVFRRAVYARKILRKVQGTHLVATAPKPSPQHLGKAPRISRYRMHQLCPL